ncbi:MAG: TonB-dependent receptor, partial [Sphingobacteriales bacterium]
MELPTATATLSPVVELLIANRDGKLSQQALDLQLQELSTINNRDNYSRHFYEQGVAQQYALRVNGSADKIAWLFALGYDNNSDQLAASYQRLNVKLENTWQLLKGLQLSARATFTQSASKTGRTDYGSMLSGTSQLPPYVQFADVQGNALPVMKDYRMKVIEGAGNGKLLNWEYTPLTDWEHSYTNDKIKDALINVSLKYTINKYLSNELQYQLDQQQNNNLRTDDADSYYTRNMVNNYTQINGNTIKRIIPLGSILNQSNTTLFAQNLRNQLNYGRDWRQHSVNVLLGAELLKSNMLTEGLTTYGYNPSLLTTVNMDYANTYPNILTGRPSFIPNRNGFSESIRRTISVFANMAYTFKQRYTVSFSARRDASNLFGVHINDKWNPLWSTGLAWNLGNEDFMNQSSWLQQLKLRATYGFSGNVNANMAAVTTISHGSTSPYTQSSYASFNNYYNPDLRWERVRTVNFGLDFQLFKALSGSIEYYRKNAVDLFGREYIDYTAGIGNAITKNAAAMSARGIDLALNYHMAIGSIKWQSSGFINYYRDKVTEYNLLSLQGSNFVNGNMLISGMVGKPVHGVFSYRWAGLDPLTGDPQGYLQGAVSKSYTSLNLLAAALGVPSPK